MCVCDESGSQNGAVFLKRRLANGVLADVETMADGMGWDDM